MQVHVLLDDKANVYCVTTDVDAAEQWLTLGAGLGVVEAELNDFTMFNEMVEELENLNDPVREV